MTSNENKFRLFVYPNGLFGCDDAVLARKVELTTVEYVCDNDHGRAVHTVDADRGLCDGIAGALSWQDRERIIEADPELQPGEYRPRIWRNGIPPSDRSPDDDSWIDPKLNPHVVPVLGAAELDALRSHIAAVHRIQQHVADVFDVVTPCEENAKVFGAAIRQAIVLAAIEVESMFTKAFADNRDPLDPGDRSDFTDWKQLFAPQSSYRR